MSPGDTLALYTDGITESSKDGAEFGEQGLIQALRRHRELAPHDQVSAIVNDVERFSSGEQYDDITLIIAKCRSSH